jgi:hypothetical protein
MHHAVHTSLVHVPQRGRDGRDALTRSILLLDLHAASHLLAREQLKLDCNLAEKPVLRVHPVVDYTPMIAVS